jgi:hypothetical protein
VLAMNLSVPVPVHVDVGGDDLAVASTDGAAPPSGYILAEAALL